MFYRDIRDKLSLDFKRLTGVSRETFESMLAVLKRSRQTFGRPSKLSEADQLLLTLMYWREYRTQYHIACAYGLSEPTVSRIIRRVEAKLLASRKFSLPQRIPRSVSQVKLTAVIVDATETAVRRPQKSRNSTTITAARRSDTRSKLRRSSR